jgi:hypothetical protein
MPLLTWMRWEAFHNRGPLRMIGVERFAMSRGGTSLLKICTRSGRPRGIVRGQRGRDNMGRPVELVAVNLERERQSITTPSMKLWESPDGRGKCAGEPQPGRPSLTQLVICLPRETLAPAPAANIWVDHQFVLRIQYYSVSSLTPATDLVVCPGTIRRQLHASSCSTTQKSPP